MKKLRRAFGSVTNLAARRDDQSSPDPPIPLGASRRSLSTSSHGLSDHRGSYVSYESQSLESYGSTISSEVDPYSKDDKNFTKLHKWAYLGDVMKLKKFIKKIPVDAQDSEGKTALHHAAAQGRGDSLLFLLGSKGNVEMKDNTGMTPFLRAVERCQIPIVQMLLQRRVDTQVKDLQGNNSMHLASKAGSVDLLSLLLDCGIDYDAVNSLGRVPLHIACSENQQEIAETLMRHGADINVTDKEGVTPLMMAAKVGSAPLVECLLEHGADATPMDSSKWSAADYARFTNHNQLHHRLSSLSEKTAKSDLFSNDLLNVSDDSSQEAGAVALKPGDKSSDVEGAVDSWSDTSEVNSIKEKPKVNLAKFLPSSDESADNVFANVTEPTSSLTGPPKPPRLYASSSSLASVTGDEGKENLNIDKEQIVKETEETDEQDLAADDDSWKSSLLEEPELKLSLFPKDTETHMTGRERSLDETADDEPQSRLKKGDLLAELNLGNIGYHSSEEEDVSFDEDDDMLPIEEVTALVKSIRRTSQAFLDMSDFKESSLPEEPNDQVDANNAISPLQSSRSSVKDKEVASAERIVSPPLSDKSINRTSLSPVPKKSPLRKSPKRSKARGSKASIYDSDTEEEVSPRRPTRRKSSTPTKKKVTHHPVLTEYDVSDEDDEKDLSTSKTVVQKDTLSSQDNKSSPLKTSTDHGKGKIEVNKLPSKPEDESRGKLNVFAGHQGLSRTSTLSTVVGTLGREGTMQEVEEMWEANASISPRRSNSDSSIQNSEEHSMSVQEDLPGVSSNITVPDQRQEIDVIDEDTEIDQSDINHDQEGISSSPITSNKDKIDMVDNNSSEGLAATSRKCSDSSELQKSPEATKTPKEATTLTMNSQDKNLKKEKVSSENKFKSSADEMQGKAIDSEKTRNHSVMSTSPSRRGSRTGTGHTSGFGSIIFSDEDSISHDALVTPHLTEEMDDVVSAASTETEESTHFNSGLKDSLLTPLSSLPNATDVSQLQDLIRELRLKLEKEFGRRVALKSQYSSLQQKENQLRLQNGQLEQTTYQLEQEISNLTRKVKQLEYLGQNEQDSSQLINQELDDRRKRCTQLEDECRALYSQALQQEQLVESLMLRLNNMDCLNQSLKSKLDELSSQTKYVSMKSSQTEDILMELHSERKADNFVEASVQTLDEHPRGTSDSIHMSNESESDVQTDKPCLNCQILQQQANPETADESVQTEMVTESTSSPASIPKNAKQDLESLCQTATIGVQSSPELVTKTSQTSISTLSHHVQTDMTNDNCKITPKKLIVDTGCQVSSTGRVASVQTDVINLTSDVQEETRGTVQTLNASEVTSVLEPALQNLSQDIRSFITEAVESHQKSLQDVMMKSIANEVHSLRENLETSFDQKSAKQSEESELKFSMLTTHLNEVLQEPVDSLKEVCNRAAVVENDNFGNVVAQLNDTLEIKIEGIKQEIGGMCSTVESSESKIGSHMEEIISDVKESNDKILRNLSDIQRESSDDKKELCEQLVQLILPQFDSIQKAIETLNTSEDSGVAEGHTRDIVTRLDSMEKSLLMSLDKSNVSQEMSLLDDELHKIGDGLQKKLSALQASVQSASSSGSIAEESLESHIEKLKESHKQLLHAFKTRTSESTTNINEAVEENFHILQDHLRKVQQSLVQRINEVSQQVSEAEDQKMSWFAKQVTEMSTQVSGMQTNLLRVQSSLEAAHSLPTTGGILDETLISSLRTSNEQAVSSLKFQNQSMIQLLESMQREIHNNMQKPESSSKDVAEIRHLRETLMEKEENLTKLNSSQESLQEKLREQVLNLERTQRKEEELRQKVESLTRKLYHLDEELKEKDESLREEKMNAANQSETVGKLQQENFNLSSENSKMSSLLNTEKHQMQLYENELRSHRDARETAEAKVHSLTSQLQLSQQQIPLQRTPPTGRDNDDDLLMKQKEIKKLETEKKELEGLCNERHRHIQQIELQMKDVEADLGLEKSNREDLEKKLKNAKATIERLQTSLSEAATEHTSLQDLQNIKAELEATVKSDEMAIDTYRKKIESVNKEKLQLKHDLMLLKNEKLSFDLVKQERDLAEEMQRKTEAQLQSLQRKLSEDYVHKSKLNHIKKEIEDKYQLELNMKVSELSRIMEERSQHQVSQAKVKESREQGLKEEVNKLSEEVIRLKAMLSVYEEETDSWKIRHDSLMKLYHHQAQNQFQIEKPNPKKSSRDALSVSLQEIDAHLKTPLASSTLLGRLTPPSSMQLPKAPTNIDSYYYTHSDNMDRMVQKYLKGAESAPSRYLSSLDDKPHARISPMQPSESFRELPTLDKSCEAYVDLLNKKYGL